MSNQRRLGRGLEALLGKPLEAAAAAGMGGPGETEKLISVYEIDRNPYQPRREFDEEATNQLAESIKEHGILQPLVVRELGGRYQLIAGERRLRAAIKAGRSSVPVRVLVADDRQMAELAIIENLQRRDLNPIEKAISFHNYLEKYGCSKDDLAARLAIDRSTVANLIRLLELPEEIQSAVSSARMSAGHARALLPLGDEEQQLALARKVQSESLSVRQTEQLVQDLVEGDDIEPLAQPAAATDSPDEPGPRTIPVSPERSPHRQALEQSLRAALGARVEILSSRSGRGRIVIHFTSPEEFDRIQAQLCASPAMGRRGAG